MFMKYDNKKASMFRVQNKTEKLEAMFFFACKGKCNTFVCFQELV